MSILEHIQLPKNEDAHLLVVDDVDANLLLLEMALGTEGYQTTRANSGEEALEKVKQQDFDLILLDVNMGGIDGFETCQLLKQDPATKDIPVIFVTANRDCTVQGFEVGGVDYLNKPVQPDEVLVRVRTHLKLRQTQQALLQANTDLQRLNGELLKAARTDTLTGLPNRRDMLEHLEQECARVKRGGANFSLAICDIDNFKHFNDRYGHDCGDFVLTSMADLFRQRLRKQDHVARWGGEEFLFLLPQTPLPQAAHVMNEVRHNIANSQYAYKELTLQVTMTFGLGEASLQPIHEALKVADEALYAGKQAGKNIVMLPDEQTGFQPFNT